MMFLHVFRTPPLGEPDKLCRQRYGVVNNGYGNVPAAVRWIGGQCRDESE
jgi:hypothetical protein